MQKNSKHSVFSERQFIIEFSDHHPAQFSLISICEIKSMISLDMNTQIIIQSSAKVHQDGFSLYKPMLFNHSNPSAQAVHEKDWRTFSTCDVSIHVKVLSLLKYSKPMTILDLNLADLQILPGRDLLNSFTSVHADLKHS